MTENTDLSTERKRPIGLNGAKYPGESNISPLAQVKQMQRVLYRRTQVEGVDNRELAQLACAWERLEERKRVMCGKPAPKPIDVQPRTPRSAVAFTRARVQLKAPVIDLVPQSETPNPELQNPVADTLSAEGPSPSTT